jgi:uncharacterized protein YceK
MKNVICILAVTTMLCGCGHIADTDAAKHIGENKTVEGVPNTTLTTVNSKNGGGMIYLTFGFPPPNQDFMVGGLNREQMGIGFSDAELSRFINYRVRVSGEIKSIEVDGKKYPCILIEDLSSIKIQ